MNRLQAISLLLALVLITGPVACGSKDKKADLPGNAELASSFIDNFVKDPGYRMGVRFETEELARRAKMRSSDLLKGCIELLEKGTPEQREKSASFLGRFGDRSAIGPLTKSLTDKCDAVREASCYALQWLDANDENTRKSVLNLCRTDPAIAVRVGAALALDGFSADDEVAAFKAGLNANIPHIWQICEDELEKKGNLELPLPEHVYRDISHQRYREIMADRRWYWIQRETTKDGRIYIEVVENVKGVPLRRNWYRTTAPQNKEQ